MTSSSSNCADPHSLPGTIVGLSLHLPSTGIKLQRELGARSDMGFVCYPILQKPQPGAQPRGQRG